MLTAAEIKSMNAEECAELAMALWENAYSLEAAKPFTEEQKRELDRRLEYDERHPGNTMPVEEFMRKYQ